MKRLLLAICLLSVVTAVHARVSPVEHKQAVQVLVPPCSACSQYGPGQALSPGSVSRGYRLILAAEGITLEQAAALVRKQSGGKLLSADEHQKNGDRVYRIKVLMPDGVVKVISIDPLTGSPVQQQR